MIAASRAFGFRDVNEALFSEPTGSPSKLSKGSGKDGLPASVQCAEGRLVTSHLRGGAGSGRASCISGATFSHRLNATTPLKFMQIGE
ncbi:hypothetical protein PUN28_010228 [Cardiocondyla obscurior]|uniref:Uncharacterized protein n=1 Tax=Cardiocondyla obscurior TaxID=286306 RepID=A0AAW2FP93_9HYME